MTHNNIYWNDLAFRTCDQMLNTQKPVVPHSEQKAMLLEVFAQSCSFLWRPQSFRHARRSSSVSFHFGHFSESAVASNTIQGTESLFSACPQFGPVLCSQSITPCSKFRASFWDVYCSFMFYNEKTTGLKSLFCYFKEIHSQCVCLWI